MQKDRSFWPAWSRFLYRSGLTDLVAALLDATGPLNILAAQAVYATRPFLRQIVSADGLQALINLFEDQEEGRSFAAFIREESPG